MSGPDPGRWQDLFRIALEIIDQAGGNPVVAPWSFGGGTALMLQIDHRESHDVDIFIEDPQVLPLLNPQIQEHDLTIAPTDYETDGTRSLKLVFNGIGEIDFICCGNVTEQPTVEKEVCGRLVNIETPAEIIAKKIHYRSQRFQPRDIFDLVAAVRTVGFEEMGPPLRKIAAQCLETGNTIKRMSPQLAESIMGQLMEIRPVFRDVPAAGRQEAIAILDRIIGPDSGNR